MDKGDSQKIDYPLTFWAKQLAAHALTYLRHFNVAKN